MTFRNIAGAGVFLLAGVGTAAAESAGCHAINSAVLPHSQSISGGILLSPEPLDAGEKISVYIQDIVDVEEGGWGLSETLDPNDYLIGPFNSETPAEQTLTVPTGGLDRLYLLHTFGGSVTFIGLKASCVAASAALPEEAAVTRLSEFDRAGTERTITTAMGNNSRARLTGGRRRRRRAGTASMSPRRGCHLTPT